MKNAAVVALLALSTWGCTLGDAQTGAGEGVSSEAVLDVDTVGTAQFFRGYLVIRDPFIALGHSYLKVILLHELAHLFGAVHGRQGIHGNL